MNDYESSINRKLRRPLHFIIPSTGNSVVNMMIINSEILVSCGVSRVYVYIHTHTHTPCYVNSDENETETLTGITRQDIKLQMKWLGLFMKFLGTLTYTLGIMFYYPENNCVRQLFGPGGTRCHNFYCIPSDNCPICSFQPQVISMNILVDVWRWAGQRLLP